jgi:hypothetical protein
MDFWNKKVNVSEEAARRHVQIYSSFPPEKRLKIALDFANMGIAQTRAWIKRNHPGFSELEITLEFVRLIHFEEGNLDKDTWLYFKQKMEEKIRKDWAKRFRIMMKANNWTYDDVAKLGGFKSGAVIQASISRGLPSFARLAVIMFEQNQNDKKENHYLAYKARPI